MKQLLQYSQKLSRLDEDRFTKHMLPESLIPVLPCGSSSISSWYFLHDASPVAQTYWITVGPDHASVKTQMKPDKQKPHFARRE